VKGQSGNPGGFSRLRQEFEEWFFSEAGDPEAREEAWAAFKTALKKGEAWAHTIYWQRMLPAQPLDVRMSRGRDEDDAFDFSKLTDEEFKALEAIFERQRALLRAGNEEKSE
jgi:hypothetical protein